MGETLIQMSRVRSTTDAENSTGSSFAEMMSFQSSLWLDTMEVRNPLDRENPIRISNVICHGTRYHQGGRKQDMTSTETFPTLRQFWLKHYDTMEVLIMDQGTEFGADFQHLCQSRCILPVVTDLETPWQNSVVERHGFEKACSLEAPTTEAEVNELIDFTFAELNRRRGTCWIFARSASFWTTTSTSVEPARRRFH